MKTAEDYTIDDLKQIIVDAWTTGVADGEPPEPWVMEKMEGVCRAALRHDGPWGPEETPGEMLDKLRDVLWKLDRVKTDLENIVGPVNDA